MEKGLEIGNVVEIKFGEFNNLFQHNPYYENRKPENSWLIVDVDINRRSEVEFTLESTRNSRLTVSILERFIAHAPDAF